MAPRTLSTAALAACAGLALPCALAQAGTLSKVLLPADVAAASGARCLDGTPAGYYWQPGSGNGTNSYVIYLEGGGTCVDLNDTDSSNCAVRAKTRLGSSSYWSATLPGKQVYGSDPATNPDFWNWNKVYIAYCSGDAHTGTRDTVVDPAAFPYYFAGHLALTAVLDYLKNTTTLAKAKDVLVTGGSAGAMGALVHADYIREQLPGISGRYGVAPQGGWFFPQTTFFADWKQGNTGPPYAGEWPIYTETWRPWAPPPCVAAHNLTYCQTAHNFYAYLKAPIFIAENQADSNQMFVQLGCPEKLDVKTTAFVLWYSQQMKASLAQIAAANATKARPDGVWAPNCISHTENLGVGDDKTKVAGVPQAAALGAWFFERSNGVPTQLIDGCLVPGCSTGCPKML